MKTSWKILAVIGLVAIISITGLGMAYADKGSITTDCQSQSPCKFSWVKYNSSSTVVHTTSNIINNGDTITFNITNDYPGYDSQISFGILNQNNTPGVISNITITYPNPNYFTMTLSGITQNKIIGAGQEVDGALDITFLRDAPNSTMGQTYTISVTIVVTQSSQPSQNKTNTCLISTPNPSTFGQPVKFTANVTGSGGTPAGTVTFYDGTKNIGAPSLVNGTATLNYSGLSVGSHSVTANFGGNANYSGSVSNVVVQVVNVNKATTTTTLLSNNDPSVFGESITFTASVSPKTVSGGVTFYDGKNIIGSGKLLGGSASISVNTLIVGSHNITAVYSGDSNFASSTSNVVVQKVRSTTITYWPSKPNPCNYGKTCTFTAQIEIQSHGIGVPTGTVTFCDGTKTLGTVSLSIGGQAKFSISSLSRGTHTITAVYGGDDNCNTSSNTFSQVIN